MSYAKNRKRKNKKAEQAMAQSYITTFDEFCEKRNLYKDNFSDSEYEKNMNLWISYKTFWKMELTLLEQEWKINYDEKINLATKEYISQLQEESKGETKNEKQQ